MMLCLIIKCDNLNEGSDVDRIMEYFPSIQANIRKKDEN